MYGTLDFLAQTDTEFTKVKTIQACYTCSQIYWSGAPCSPRLGDESDWVAFEVAKKYECL